MSIIRDLLEYYRLPPDVVLYQSDFSVSHTILNGYEERYYYEGPPISMVIDQYTDDDVRFRRTYFYYDAGYVLQQVVSQYDYGKKQKTEDYTYGSYGEILTITSEETDVDITWSNMASSTGWPVWTA